MMRRFANIFTAVSLSFFLVFCSAQTWAAQKNDASTKVSSGVKATIKVDPSKGMVDFYLSNVAAKKPITDAKVRAVVTLPNGKKVEKDLVGMKMEDTFSYMETLDMGIKGTYVFDISVEAGAKKLKFSFKVRN